MKVLGLEQVAHMVNKIKSLVHGQDVLIAEHESRLSSAEAQLENGGSKIVISKTQPDSSTQEAGDIWLMPYD